MKMQKVQVTVKQQVQRCYDREWNQGEAWNSFLMHLQNILSKRAMTVTLVKDNKE